MSNCCVAIIFVICRKRDMPLMQGVMSNGPATTAAVPQTLQQAGHLSGDPFEISTIRREVK